VFTLYSLAVQQLSQQEHYDFGLRALVSVLKYAGRKKRALPEYPDEEILLLAMKDMNVAKLTSGTDSFIKDSGKSCDICFFSLF
jgi:dynein heavy chain